MDILFNTDDLQWTTHPSVKGVLIKKIVTTEKFGKASPTILIVKIPADVEVPEHVHEKSEDILFILSGKGTIRIDGSGKRQLQPGTVIRVPRNTKHNIFDIQEELLVYDVFTPGIM